MGGLSGSKIAILVAADGVPEVELTEPRRVLENEGARTELISPHGPEIQTHGQLERSETFGIDRTLDSASVFDYRALLLPGGTANCDSLRQDEAAVGFVRSFFDAQKPVAAICHAAWVLVEAAVLEGRTVATDPSLHFDLKSAGATCAQRDVVTDLGLVTSRGVRGLAQFCWHMVAEFATYQPALTQNHRREHELAARAFTSQVGTC